MKRTNMLMAALMFAAVSFAQNVKTAVFNTSPEMHCGGCENRVKNGLKSEKGVKDIKTDLETKTVTIEYDADQTNTTNLVAAFAKINYTATEVAGDKAAAKKGGCCCGGGAKKAEAETSEAAKGGCCGGGKKAEAGNVAETPAKKGGCGCGKK